MKYVLILSDYDGAILEKFKTKQELEDRAAVFLKKEGIYGSSIIFAGEIKEEFEFEPQEVVVKYRAVSKEAK